MTERRLPGKVLWGAVATMSAAGIVFTLGFEGSPRLGQTESVATIPVKGDPPTLDVGGLTYYPSTGQRVRIGDRVPVGQAIREFSLAAEQDAACVRRSCPLCETALPLFDIASDFVHQFGCAAWHKSSLLGLLRSGREKEHSDFYLQYRFVRKFDCATPGNRVCAGVWARTQARAALCHAALRAVP